MERSSRQKRVRASDGSSVARWFTPGFTGPVVDRIRAQLLATSPIGYVGACAAIRDLALSPDRISVPTLIIAGGVDPATPPERSSEIARAMPRMPEVITLAAAHLSNLEQPSAFNRAVLDFLS